MGSFPPGKDYAGAVIAYLLLFLFQLSLHSDLDINLDVFSPSFIQHQVWIFSPAESLGSPLGLVEAGAGCRILREEASPHSHLLPIPRGFSNCLSPHRLPCPLIPVQRWLRDTLDILRHKDFHPDGPPPWSPRAVVSIPSPAAPRWPTVVAGRRPGTPGAAWT